MRIIKVEKLKKYYGENINHNQVCALDGIDLEVMQGEFVAIVGMSGSGKSTLLHMLGGLDIPTSGTVLVDEQDLAKMTDEQLTIFRRRKIGFIFQNYVDEIISTLGLAEKRTAMPNMLSGGQQQRVAIARALATKPSIILADEPTGNLDSKTSEDVLVILRMALKKYNQTLVMITHNDYIAQLADRTINIKDGKISEVVMDEKK